MVLFSVAPVGAGDPARQGPGSLTERGGPKMKGIRGKRQKSLDLNGFGLPVSIGGKKRQVNLCQFL